MAQLQHAFNAQAVDPTQGGSYNQLPPGKHPVVIKASEIKPTNDGQSGMVAFELECIGGPSQGQSGVMNLNLYNKSEKARAIAESQFSALCHACSVFMVTDTQQLHNIPFAVEVETRPLTEEQKAKQAAGETVTPFTQVRKILDFNGNEPKAGGQQQQAAAPQQQQAQQPAGNAAWGGGGQAASPSPAPAPAQGNGGWGAGQAAQAPAQAAAPAAQGNGGGWQQGAAQTSSGPAWGR